MRFCDVKWVTGNNLKIGDEIIGYKIDTRSVSFHRIVVAKTPFEITVAMDSEGKLGVEKIDAKRALFEIELTEREFYLKWNPKAKEIYKRFYNKLHLDELGYHEQDNSWLEYDPHTLARALEENKYTLWGHSTDIEPKRSWFGQDLTVGVCVEDVDGNRFWCHASSDIFEYMDRGLEIAKYYIEGGE